MNQQEIQHQTGNSTNAQNENDQKNILEDLLKNKGITSITFGKIVLAFSLLLVDGMFIHFFSSMIIPLAKYYEFSKLSIEILPGLIFLSNAFGSFSLGYITALGGRITLLYLFTFLILVSHVLMVFIKSMIIFAISRIVIGFSIGITTPTVLSIVSEYLPMNNRGLILCFIWSGNSLGTGLLQLIMYFVMPNLEVEKVHLTLLVSGLIPLFSLLMCFLFAEDGPRHLILKDQEIKAIEIIERINEDPLSEYEKTKIILQIKTGANQKMKDKYWEIFNKDYWSTTVLMSIIRCTHGLFHFGILVVYSLTIKSLELRENTQDPKAIIENELFTSFLMTLSNFMAGYIIEFQSLGRKVSMIINYMLCFVSIVFFVCDPKIFTFFISISLLFSNAATVVTHTYSVEVFPTQIRDQAVGFLFSQRRLGGFLSQIIYIGINRKGIFIPYYFSLILILLDVIAVFILPYETLNQALDKNMGEENMNKNLQISEDDDNKKLI